MFACGLWAVLLLFGIDTAATARARSAGDAACPGGSGTLPTVHVARSDAISIAAAEYGVTGVIAVCAGRVGVIDPGNRSLYRGRAVWVVVVSGRFTGSGGGLGPGPRDEIPPARCATVDVDYQTGEIFELSYGVPDAFICP